MINNNIKTIFDSICKLNNTLSSMPGIIPCNNIIAQDVDFLKNNISNADLRKVVSKLFKDGHHARSIEEAFKYIDNLVKKTAKPEDMSLTGAKLMGRVFNPTSTLLKINSGSTQSEIDEQNGYMQILSGCMIGIRNPRAHEHDWEDTEQRTIQLLVLADHLISRIKSSEKVIP